LRRNGGRGAPILVVDDDPGLCDLVAATLEPLGLEVRWEGTAAAALAAVHARRPALVLLDVQLPDLSGYEVCRELRDEFGEGLPIVFVSGHRVEEYDQAAGLLLGGDDYLVKPFSPGELIARVRRALERAGPRDDGAASPLTTRELDVLRLLADGVRQERIAEQLFITPKTVATHIQHILTKLELHSRAEAVAYAHREGLFQ
jgi:DNA-binding NarL/FixJ family response regulator